MLHQNDCQTVLCVPDSLLPLACSDFAYGCIDGPVLVLHELPSICTRRACSNILGSPQNIARVCAGRFIVDRAPRILLDVPVMWP